MLEQNNETTISTYVSFLKAVGKKLTRQTATSRDLGAPICLSHLTANNMKTPFPLIALLIFFLSACGEKKPPRSKEAEVIWNLQNDQTQPDYVRKGAEVMLDVLEEKENIKLRDYFNADRKVSSVRSEAIARTWIALLHSTEKKIPVS